MIILSSADFHILCLKKLLKDKAYERAEKALISLSHAVWEQNPDVLVISGDVFNSSYPSRDEMYLFNMFLLPILKEGITVIIIPGNHDSDREGGKTALNFLEPFDEAIENFHVALNKFKHIIVGDTLFLMWPWGILPSKKDLNKVKHLKDYKRIGILHITLMNTIISESGNTLKKGYTIASLKEAIKLFELDYVLMGDIHEYQHVIKNKAIYPGALYQTKFNESPEKGIVRIDTDKEDISFIEIKNVPKLLNITSFDLPIKQDSNLYTLNVESKEEYIKLSNASLPENIVRVAYPFGKVVTNREVIESNRKMGFSISITHILIKVLKKQGVKDIRGAIKYLFTLAESKNDLILP